MRKQEKNIAQQRKGSRSQRRPRSRSPVDRNKVPTLKYGTDNNFPLFKRNASMAAMEKYGDLGRLIELGEYYEPDEVEIEDYELDDDPHGLNLSDLREARKNRTRRINKMECDRAGMYAFLLLHLSNESLDAVKLQDNWDVAHSTKNPLALWLLVELTHRVGTTSRIPKVLKSESRRAYQAVAQSSFESIVKFKERFDTLLENYYEHENPDIVTFHH